MFYLTVGVKHGSGLPLVLEVISFKNKAEDKSETRLIHELNQEL